MIKMSDSERRALAEKNLRTYQTHDGVAWVTTAPCLCSEPNCNRMEEYCGQTPEEAIHNAMTEVK